MAGDGVGCEPSDKDGQGPRRPRPEPTTELGLYRRGPFGKKHFYVPSKGGPEVGARYFIQNPVPQKHSDSWKPVMHIGDNPKHYEGGHKVARARRTGFWSSFRIELGDGVDEVLENKSRVQKRKNHERKQKWRKAFCMGERPPKEPLEDEQEVKGFVMALTMRRRAFLNRTLTFNWAGEQYRWSGTRQFMPAWSNGLKGLSHDFKLVNSNGDLVATFEKDRWVSYKPSEKPGNLYNKNKSLVGTLRIYPAARRTTTLDMKRHNSAGIQSKIDNFDHKMSGNKGKLERNVNLDGEHVGNLTEEVIAFSCWMVVEAEHRLRYKIFDLLEEVAENAGG